MAPEIHMKQAYEGKVVDLFASAVILFMVCEQAPPFSKAMMTDIWYKCLNTNLKMYWSKIGEGFSNELRDLVAKMLSYKPEDRLSMEEVYAHAWMQGEMPTHEEILAEFNKKELIVNK